MFNVSHTPFFVCFTYNELCARSGNCVLSVWTEVICCFIDEFTLPEICNCSLLLCPIDKRFTLSSSDSNDKAARCRGFYYCLSCKDLQLSPSAKSSTSSLAKSFEVILSERKTPTLVHKPCQGLYRCPYVKLIPILKPPPHTLINPKLPPELYEACQERNRRSE